MINPQANNSFPLSCFNWLCYSRSYYQTGLLSAAMSHTFQSSYTKNLSRISAPGICAHSTRVLLSCSYHDFFVSSRNPSLQSSQKFIENNDVSCKRHPPKYGHQTPRVPLRFLCSVPRMRASEKLANIWTLMIRQNYLPRFCPLTDQPCTNQHTLPFRRILQA